jgi:hypothetical protein
MKMYYKRILAILPIFASFGYLGTPELLVSAQNVQSIANPLLISQRERRSIRAVSGPDEQGRWRFNKPSDISNDAMREQGCVDVGRNNAQRWRCPSQRIKVYTNDRDRYNTYDRGWSRNRRSIQAVSGPDDRGRWRFNKPNGISDDAMREQGCVDVGRNNAQRWRCPSQRIRVREDR